MSLRNFWFHSYFQQAFFSFYLVRSCNIMRYISCFQISHFFTPVRHVSSCTAAITKIHRKTYSRTYPTLLVQPDGSTIRIRYHEPRRIIEVSWKNHTIDHIILIFAFFFYQIPVDMGNLTEEEREKLIRARNPPKQIHLEKKLEDSFDARKYARYVKN